MAIGAAPNPSDRAAMKAWRAERREIALRLSIAGWSYERIRRERPDLGYNNKQTVHNDIETALKEYRERQDLAAADKIARHEMLLNEAIEAVHDIMNRRHLATGNGKVVQRFTGEYDADKVPIYEDVYDDSVNLAAADKLRQLSESLRKLGGLDAPAKVQAQVDGTVSYSINVTSDEMDKL